MLKAILPSRYECPKCKRIEMRSRSWSQLREFPVCTSCSFNAEVQGVDLVLVEGQPFQIGDGVHWSFNGDSYLGTVRKVSKSGREVWVSNDDHVATKKEKELVEKHGVHEGPIDSIFTPRDVPESQWRKFRLMNNKRKRNVFSDGTFNLWHGREFAYNPSL